MKAKNSPFKYRTPANSHLQVVPVTTPQIIFLQSTGEYYFYLFKTKVPATLGLSSGKHSVLLRPIPEHACRILNKTPALSFRTLPRVRACDCAWHRSGRESIREAILTGLSGDDEKLLVNEGNSGR